MLWLHFAKTISVVANDIIVLLLELKDQSAMLLKEALSTFIVSHRDTKSTTPKIPNKEIKGFWSFSFEHGLSIEVTCLCYVFKSPQVGHCAGALSELQNFASLLRRGT